MLQTLAHYWSGKVNSTSQHDSCKAARQKQETVCCYLSRGQRNHGLRSGTPTLHWIGGDGWQTLAKVTAFWVTWANPIERQSRGTTSLEQMLLLLLTRGARSPWECHVDVLCRLHNVWFLFTQVLFACCRKCWKFNSRSFLYFLVLSIFWKQVKTCICPPCRHSPSTGQLVQPWVYRRKHRKQGWAPTPVKSTNNDYIYYIFTQIYINIHRFMHIFRHIYA